jgi:hypothetical protein
MKYSNIYVHVKDNIYIYIYICLCVCVCVCMYVFCTSYLRKLYVLSAKETYLVFWREILFDMIV